MIFSFDANVFIDMKKYYPRESNNKLWEIIEDKMNNYEILISKEVLIELKRKSDGLSKWLNKYQDNIIESVEEIQYYVIYLVNKYQGWIDPNSTTNQADPYVIALADYHKGAVVTQEKIHRHLNENPDQIPNQPHALKIPNICNLENIAYFDILYFVTVAK